MLNHSTLTERTGKTAWALALAIGLLFSFGAPLVAAADTTEPGGAPPEPAAQVFDPVASSNAGPDGWEHWLDNEYYKFHLNVRARIELADFDHLESSQAYTVRTRFGLGTKPFYGFSVYGEGENILSAAPSEYWDGIGTSSGQSIIADPEKTELNQLWARYENADLLGVKLTGGRQRIKLDDDRFIGNVGWRQNEQTYDSTYVSFSPGVEHLRTEYGYIWDVRRIWGNRGRSKTGTRNWDSDSHLIRLAYDRWKAAKLIAFAYLLDFDTDSPVNSANSYGLRVTGKSGLSGPWGLAYAGSYAVQTDAGKNPVDYTAHYVAAEVNLIHSDIGAIGPGYELLSSDNGKARFVTPLATGHKFNGWADAFLNNGGPNGLQDLYVTVSPKLPWDLKGKLVYHHFWSDQGSNSLANEIDTVLSKAINKHVTVLTKAAWLDGTSRGPVDRWRWWVQLTFTY